MNKYAQFKERKEKEINNFPMVCAIDNASFDEGMKKLGLLPTDTDKVYKFGELGIFFRKTDAEAFQAMMDRHDSEFKEAVTQDVTGEGFIADMFDNELTNHEYTITMSEDDALRALGLTDEDVANDEKLSTALKLAKTRQWKQFDESEKNAAAAEEADEFER